MSEYNQQGQNVNNQWNAGRDINITNLEIYAPCPICDRNNKIEKVSAILDRETHNANGITSVLAMKLKAPARPKAKGKPIGWAWSLLIGYVILAGGETIVGGLVSIYGLSGRSIDRYAPVKVMTPENIIFNLGLGIGLCILGLLLFWCSRWLYKKYKTKKEIYIQVEKIVSEQEYPKWEKAMERWKKLYYCYTDGCVFIPGEKTWAESDAINEYVYRTI